MRRKLKRDLENVYKNDNCNVRTRCENKEFIQKEEITSCKRRRERCVSIIRDTDRNRVENLYTVIMRNWAEIWNISRKEENSIQTLKVNLLRNTRRDKVRNERIGINESESFHKQGRCGLIKIWYDTWR